MTSLYDLYFYYYLFYAVAFGGCLGGLAGVLLRMVVFRERRWNLWPIGLDFFSGLVGFFAGTYIDLAVRSPREIVESYDDGRLITNDPHGTAWLLLLSIAGSLLFVTGVQIVLHTIRVRRHGGLG